jgi:uncharacterized protein YbjT (DUF2867 family)
MKVIIFGATGMVGQGVLRECLLDPDIELVLTVGRNSTNIGNQKLREIAHADLLNYTAIEDRLSGFDACFFCLGVSSFRMDPADYARITYGYTIATATTLSRLNPAMVFTYVTGAGTDSTEHGRSRWARVKGRTENKLLSLPFKGAYMFRPGAIRPMHGITSKTKVYRIFLTLSAPIWPLVQRSFPRQITTTENIGIAMIEVAKYGWPKQILETADIYAVSENASARQVK